MRRPAKACVFAAVLGLTMGCWQVFGQAAPPPPAPGGGPEAEFKRMDTNNDGKLSLEEWQLLMPPAVFKTMDANNDGVVTLDEIKKAPPMGPPPAPAAAEPAPLAPAAPAPPAAGPPGAAAPRRPDMPEGGRRGRFAQVNAFLVLFDQNGDGAVTQKELLAVFKSLDADKDDKVTEEESAGIVRAKMLLAQFDANDDGTLSQDEVGPGMWSRLSSADSDGNGVLTEAELRSVMLAPVGPPGPPPGAPGPPPGPPAQAAPPGAPTPPAVVPPPAAAGPPIEAEFKRMDANNDGKLSREEFQTLMPPPIFDQLDANKDGSVTLDEYGKRPAP